MKGFFLPIKIQIKLFTARRGESEKAAEIAKHNPPNWISGSLIKMKTLISIYKLACTADQLRGPESFASTKLMLKISNLPPTRQHESLHPSLLIQVR